MQIILITLRALSGPSGSLFFLPCVFTAITFENPSLINDTIIAAFDIDRLSIDQRIGNNLSAVLDDSSECGPRDTHAFSGLFVRHAEQVGEPNGFTLINGQAHLFQLHHRNTPGLKITDRRIKGDPSVFLRPYHGFKLLYENILKKLKLRICDRIVKFFRQALAAAGISVEARSKSDI
jgi:hypothetical protein